MSWLLIVFALLPMLGTYIVKLSRRYAAVSPHGNAQWLASYSYAHRGLHKKGCPENSLLAFERAADAGYAVEMDIQKTADGKVVVFHDRDLRRMTGESGKVSDYTLQELKRLRLEGTGQQIPTLEEALMQIRGRVPVLVEIKNAGKAGEFEQAVYKTLKGYSGLYAVQSFFPMTLRWFKKNAPEVCRGRLMMDIRPTLTGIKNRVFKYVSEKALYWAQKFNLNVFCRPNFVCCEISKPDLPFISKIRKRGAPVFAWTVGSEEQMKTLSPHFDGMIFEGFRPPERGAA
ncbi:MAG: glycerophosphodiester phosphodiesterase family protein [Christensenellaceae bacterium]|jgi:glycerophosphoryl diester phosphodiesterase